MYVPWVWFCGQKITPPESESGGVRDEVLSVVAV
jgi:hypothetical protein